MVTEVFPASPRFPLIVILREESKRTRKLLRSSSGGVGTRMDLSSSWDRGFTFSYGRACDDALRLEAQ